MKVLVILLFSLALNCWSAGLGYNSDKLDMLLGPANKGYWTFADGAAGFKVKCEFKASKVKSMSFTYRGGDIIPSASFWQVMDWVGEGTDWLEISEKGLKNKQLDKKKISGVQLRWLSMAGGARKAILAQMKGALLKFDIVELKKEKPQKLEVLYKGDNSIFGDFQKVSACNEQNCRLHHSAYPSLILHISKGRLNYSYENLDKESILFPSNFANLKKGEQKEVLSVWLDFLNHEYGVMCRAFIHSTPGVFNWQAWHWQDWRKNGFISEQRLSQYFISGKPGQRLEIFQEGPVLMEVDANGRYWMQVNYE